MVNAAVNNPPSSSCFSQASTSSHGMLTLDLVAEEDGALQEYDDDCDDSWENALQMEGSCGQADVIQSRQRADTDVSKLRVTSKEPKVKTSSLPRGSERSWGKNSHLDAAKVHKKHQVQLELLLFFILKLDENQTDLIRFQLWGYRFFRLSLEHHNQGRGSSRTLGVAVPPWMKCCPPGTPRPRGPMLSPSGSDQSSIQKTTGPFALRLKGFLSLSHLPQTCHDPLRVAVRTTSLPNRRGSRKCVSGAAGGSAAEPHRSEDAESSGASGGDAAAGQMLASLKVNGCTEMF